MQRERKHNSNHENKQFLEFTCYLFKKIMISLRFNSNYYYFSAG